MSLFKRKQSESAAALTEIQASFTSLQEELASAQEETKAAQESAANLLAEFTRADALTKEQAATIEALNTALAEASRDAALFDEKVAKAAAATVAQIGHEPLSIIEEEEPADILKTFKGLRGNELVKFYQANRKEIDRALKNGK